MVEHANGDVVDPRLVPLDQVFERLVISRAGAQNKALVLVVGGIICKRIIDIHGAPPSAHMPWLDSHRALGIAEKWALTIFHCPLCLMKTKVVRPWIEIILPSFVTPVNMSWAFTIPTVSPYTRHDGCRKPKLAEAKPSTTSLRYLAKSGLPSNRYGTWSNTSTSSESIARKVLRSRWSKASANCFAKAWSSFTLMFVSPLMS